MSNELFKQFLDQLSESELRNIVSKSNIPIEGFRSTSNNIPIAKLKSGIVIFLNKYRSKILIQDKDSYLNLQRKNIHSFNLQILHDLYNNINTEIIKNLLDELKNSANFEDKDKSDIEINDLQKINNELIKENDELNKRIKEITKQLKQKQEDFVKQQNLNQKEKNKLENEIKQIKQQRENTNFELIELRRMYNDEKNINDSKDKYINDFKEQIKNYNRIIMYRLIPTVDEFLYNYKFVDKLENLELNLLDQEFTGLWYPEKMINPFEINKIFDFLEKKRIFISIQSLNEKDLKTLKLEVKL